MQRGLTSAIALILLSGCATTSALGPVLRVEYRFAPGTEPGDPGVIFWRGQSIRGDEIPEDLFEKLAQSFPMLHRLDGKLANTCYYTTDQFGLALLQRRPSRLGGALWLTADASWSVDFVLAADGTVRGTMNYSSSANPYPLVGTHRQVSDFDECYEKVREQISKRAPE